MSRRQRRTVLVDLVHVPEATALGDPSQPGTHPGPQLSSCHPATSRTGRPRCQQGTRGPCAVAGPCAAACSPRLFLCLTQSWGRGWGLVEPEGGRPAKLLRPSEHGSWTAQRFCSPTGAGEGCSTLTTLHPASLGELCSGTTPHFLLSRLSFTGPWRQFKGAHEGR